MLRDNFRILQLPDFRYVINAQDHNSVPNDVQLAMLWRSYPTPLEAEKAIGEFCKPRYVN
jgi:hypothetical protein